MDRYDATDFAQHPSKYALFTTARLAGHIVTHNGEHDLTAGTVVRLRYQGATWNRLYRRLEPMFMLPDHGIEVSGSLLADFVL